MTASVRAPLARLLSVACLGAALAAPLGAQASTVYDNTTTDLQFTFFFSSGPFTQLGERISLGGTDRVLTDVTVQFSNALPTAGSFDAEIQLYGTGSPVGSLLGTFAANGNAIGGQSILNVSFTGLNLQVPTDMAYAVSVSNVVGPLELGLNAFSPPTIGSSHDQLLLINAGNGLVDIASQPGLGNLYFLAHTAPVPEPSAILLAAMGVLALMSATRRRRAAVATVATR